MMMLTVGFIIDYAFLCRDSDDRQLGETWIGISWDIFARVDSYVMPGCESPAHFKHRPFSSPKPDEARMGYGNFHCAAPNIP